MSRVLALSSVLTVLSLAASTGYALAQTHRSHVSATNENYCLEHRDGSLNCTYATLESCYIDRVSEGVSCIENPSGLGGRQ
jgi:hypothetical protein